MGYEKYKKEKKRNSSKIGARKHKIQTAEIERIDKKLRNGEYIDHEEDLNESENFNED